MADFDAIAEEYRIAYLQLQHCEQQMDEMEASLKRDHDLAVKRYEMARAAFVTLALGEADAFLVTGE
jgi:hypothetical protein